MKVETPLLLLKTSARVSGKASPAWLGESRNWKWTETCLLLAFFQPFYFGDLVTLVEGDKVEGLNFTTCKRCKYQRAKYIHTWEIGNHHHHCHRHHIHHTIGIANIAMPLPLLLLSPSQLWTCIDKSHCSCFLKNRFKVGLNIGRHSLRGYQHIHDRPLRNSMNVINFIIIIFILTRENPPKMAPCSA